MRTLVKHGLIAVAVTGVLALTACNESNQSQPPRDPVSANDPKPQRPFNDPAVQQPSDPIANNHNPSQRPFNDPTPQDPSFKTQGPQPAINDPAPQKPFYGPGTTSSENRVLAKTERPLTDAEILGAANAANQGEVSTAELAIRKATNTDVKEFAGMLKSHHTAGLQKGKTVMQKTKIAPADSDVSTYLTNDLGSVLKDLRDKEGRAFDRAYIESQVKAHKDVLQAIDNRLTPSVKNGEVKTMLVEMRRAVVDHLAKAEDLQKKVDVAASLGGHNSSMVGLGVPQGREPKQAKEPNEKGDKKSSDSKGKIPEKTEPRP